MRPDKVIQHTELGGDPHKHIRCIGVPIKLNTTNYPIETPHTRHATADARQMPKNPQPLPWTVREWDRVKCSSAGLGRSGGPGLVALSTRILYGAVNTQYKTVILVGSNLTFSKWQQLAYIRITHIAILIYINSKFFRKDEWSFIRTQNFILEQ